MRSMSNAVRFVVLAGFMCAGIMSNSAVSAQTTPPPLDTMPRWAEFPVLPTDVPTAADIKARVNVELARQKQLDAEVAALVWDRQEPDQIRDSLLSRIDEKRASPVDQALTSEQLEALAAALRARAAPPPIAN